MTKNEYRRYIAGEDWRSRRKQFIEEMGARCERCDIPRAVAVVAYDQDLHVHHRSYANLGSETQDDLEILCRRCHDIETFGSSDLHEISFRKCKACGGRIWGQYSEFDGICEPCCVFVVGLSPRRLEFQTLDHSGAVWESALRLSLWLFGRDEIDRVIAEYFEIHRDGPKNITEQVAQLRSKPDRKR